MSPVPARAGLAPACYLPPRSPFARHAAGLLLRRAVLSLIEIGCILVFVAAVLLCAALGSGA